MSGTNSESTPEFDEFVASGEVEVGKPEGEAADGVQESKRPAARRGPPKEPAAKADAKSGEEKGGEDDQQDDEGGEDEGKKPQKSAKDHQIDRLKREKAELARKLRMAAREQTTEERLAALEKRGLSGDQNGDKSRNQETPAPDPTDTEKYPLGHLDDRYIEDKIAYLAEREAAKRADAALQRQQEAEQTQAQQRQQRELLGKVDDLAARGSELYEDFQESVVETGMRGDWDLSQATFEAAHEAENGAQILYELSQDKKEATRVAGLSNYQQMKFVQERDAAIAAEKTPRRKPGAPAPPENTAQGRNSKTQINPATENLDDFEKAWERDAKGKR